MSGVYTGQFNGYSVADRQLEDVMFDVSFTLDKEAKTLTLDTVTLEDSFTSYVEGLGPKGTVQYWCDQVRTCIESDPNYAFMEICQETISEDDVDWVMEHLEGETPEPESVPVQVEKITMSSLF